MKSNVKPTMNNWGTLVAFSAALVAGAIIPQMAEAQQKDQVHSTTIEYTISAEDSAAIWAVLDQYMENFRQPVEKYFKKHLETYLMESPGLCHVGQDRSLCQAPERLRSRSIIIQRGARRSTYPGR
jgi:hypothetical protein